MKICEEGTVFALDSCICRNGSTTIGALIHVSLLSGQHTEGLVWR